MNRLKFFSLCIIIIFLSMQFIIMFSNKEIKVLRAKTKLLIDLEFINNLAENLNFSIYIIDEEFNSIQNFPHDPYRLHPTILGIDAQYLEKLSFILNNRIMRRDDDVFVEVFYNENPLMENHGFKLNAPIALVMEKNYAFIFYILYSREDNTFWYGNLASDGQCYNKLKKFHIAKFNCNRSALHENILNKFEFSIFDGFQKPLQHFMVPKDWNNFVAQSSYSDFIECNYTRSELFKKTYIRDYKNDLRFKHRAWKLLAKAKTILDFLNKPFWISSGTCLGYFRECGFIPYSKDVDIAMFSKDYSDNIIKTMEYHGLKLLHLFGLPNDSLELSFIDQGGIKLDIFFFYEEDGYFWNGGTQLKTGKKFKYIFPKFSLCWTLFMGLKVRVPCDTEKYIVANYGHDWFTPIHEWDWKTSPHNVHPNGFWTPYFHRTHLLKKMFITNLEEEEGITVMFGKVNGEEC